MNVFADDCCRIQQLHRPSDVHGVHPHPHLDLRPLGQVGNRRSCRVTHVLHQGFLSHSTPDHSWKRGRNSLKAVHSSKIPWDFGLTWGKLFFAFLYIVAIGQVHVWTLTPSDMVLTAHITYQNRSIYSEIHTQVLRHILRHTQVLRQTIFSTFVTFSFSRWRLSSTLKAFLK